MNNNTEVIFENIEQRILKEIEDAHYAIFVSVAWFTNQKLFNALLEKAKHNCYVSIIIQLDDINSQSGIDYSQIQVGRSECFRISKDAELLHDKFCVIDFKKVITGSYNWTYKASYNSENILILNDPSVATQYISRFEQQKAKLQKLNALENDFSSTSTANSPQVTSNIQANVASEEHLSTKQCPNCKKDIECQNRYCKYCGELQDGFIHSIIDIKCETCTHTQNNIFIDSHTKFCTNCGNQIKNQTTNKLCPICNKIYEDGEKYCTSCGTPKYIFSPFIVKRKSDTINPLKGIRPEFIT